MTGSPISSRSHGPSSRRADRPEGWSRRNQPAAGTGEPRDELAALGITDAQQIEIGVQATGSPPPVQGPWRGSPRGPHHRQQQRGINALLTHRGEQPSITGNSCSLVVK